MKDTYDDDFGSTIPGNIWADKGLLAIDTKSQKKKQSEQWQAENSNAINAYNSHVEAHRVFSDYVRSF
jgi:antitoxin CcdA